MNSKNKELSGDKNGYYVSRGNKNVRFFFGLKMAFFLNRMDRWIENSKNKKKHIQQKKQRTDTAFSVLRARSYTIEVV